MSPSVVVRTKRRRHTEERVLQIKISKFSCRRQNSLIRYYAYTMKRLGELNLAKTKNGKIYTCTCINNMTFRSQCAM